MRPGSCVSFTGPRQACECRVWKRDGGVCAFLKLKYWCQGAPQRSAGCPCLPGPWCHLPLETPGSPPRQSLFPPLPPPPFPLLPPLVLDPLLILDLVCFPFQLPSLPNPGSLFSPESLPSSLSGPGPAGAGRLERSRSPELVGPERRVEMQETEWWLLIHDVGSSSAPKCFPCNVLSAPLLCSEKFLLPSLWLLSSYSALPSGPDAQRCRGGMWGWNELANPHAAEDITYGEPRRGAPAVAWERWGVPNVAIQAGCRCPGLRADTEEAGTYPVLPRAWPLGRYIPVSGPPNAPWVPEQRPRLPCI